MAFKAYPTDPNRREIRSANSIASILNISITTGTWTAITVPSGIYHCKSSLIQTRDGSPFLLSHLAAGTTYATVNQPLGIDLVGRPGGVLCYVKATVAGTLEVILLD